MMHEVELACICDALFSHTHVAISFDITKENAYVWGSY